MGVPASEVTFDPTQLNGTLKAGLDFLTQAQDYPFQLYMRKILPVDGYVFWTPSGTPTPVKGSLHYALETQQDADQVAGDGDILFATTEQLGTLGQASTTANPSQLYVVTVGENATDDPKSNPIRFSFRRQGHFYQQAGLWHYSGQRVTPFFATQLLDKGNTVDLTRAVVSNSLPFWLAMNSYAQPYPGAPTGPGVTIYPSFEVAENAAPPYAVVDIVDTIAIGSVPLLNGAQFGYHTQLVKDTIDITLVGLQNNESLAFQDFINQYSMDTDNIGLLNMPVVKDLKRTAPHMKTIAMAKSMRYEVSYYQSISTSVARQLIESAAPTFIINPSDAP
jgi:hypothetical protein